MFEYLAAGKAVVGAVAVEAAQILRDAGAVVVPPEDSAALADAIRMLAADPQRRQAMGRLCRAHVEEWFGGVARAGAIRMLAAGPQRLQAMGRLGRAHVEDCFDRIALAREYRQILALPRARR